MIGCLDDGGGGRHEEVRSEGRSRLGMTIKIKVSPGTNYRYL